jgi:hypothetical protein
MLIGSARLEDTSPSAAITPRHSATSLSARIGISLPVAIRPHSLRAIRRRSKAKTAPRFIFKTLLDI